MLANGLKFRPQTEDSDVSDDVFEAVALPDIINEIMGNLKEKSSEFQTDEGQKLEVDIWVQETKLRMKEQVEEMEANLPHIDDATRERVKKDIEHKRRAREEGNLPFYYDEFEDQS